MALKDEYIDEIQGSELQTYNKERVIIICHVSYCRIQGRYGCDGKQTCLYNIRIQIGDKIYILPEEKYSFYNTDCFDKFVGCDIKFVATINVTQYKDEYYIDILRPSKISKISVNENNVMVTYFTRYQETFIYDDTNKELPMRFYELTQEMDKYKVGHGKYYSMSLEDAYESNYGRINVR